MLPFALSFRISFIFFSLCCFILFGMNRQVTKTIVISEDRVEIKTVRTIYNDKKKKWDN